MFLIEWLTEWIKSTESINENFSAFFLLPTLSCMGFLSYSIPYYGLIRNMGKVVSSYERPTNIHPHATSSYILSVMLDSLNNLSSKPYPVTGRLRIKIRPTQSFLRLIPNPWTTKEKKWINWTLSQWKTFVLQRAPSRKCKDNQQQKVHRKG